MPAATVSEGGKAQLLVGPDGSRRGLWLQNNSAGDLRLVEGGADAATDSGIRIAANGYYETPPSRRGIGSWSVWGATKDQKFEWGTW